MCDLIGSLYIVIGNASAAISSKRNPVDGQVNIRSKHTVTFVGRMAYCAKPTVRNLKNFFQVWMGCELSNMLGR